MLGKIRNKLKGKKGFTMVELIIVIVIILILAAALVPQLLKYVEKANQANCKADAATILSQVQADYAAMQASDQTEVTKITEVGDVKVEEKTGNNAVVKGDVAEKEAKYGVTTTGGENEITSFAYNNGKYTAVWASTTGWTVEKN